MNLLNQRAPGIAFKPVAVVRMCCRREKRVLPLSESERVRER